MIATFPLTYWNEQTDREREREMQTEGNSERTSVTKCMCVWEREGWWRRGKVVEREYIGTNSRGSCTMGNNSVCQIVDEYEIWCLFVAQRVLSKWAKKRWANLKQNKKRNKCTHICAFMLFHTCIQTVRTEPCRRVCI